MQPQFAILSYRNGTAIHDSFYMELPVTYFQTFRLRQTTAQAQANEQSKELGPAQEQPKEQGRAQAAAAGRQAAAFKLV